MIVQEHVEDIGKRSIADAVALIQRPRDLERHATCAEHAHDVESAEHERHSCGDAELRAHRRDGCGGDGGEAAQEAGE